MSYCELLTMHPPLSYIDIRFYCNIFRWFILHRGSLYTYDNSIAWWAFAVAANYAGRCYEFAMQPIKALQQSIESQIFSDLETLEADALDKYNKDVVMKFFITGLF